MDVLRFALLGLGASGAYAILAQGIAVIYRGSGVVNFAQGATAMWAAYLVFLELRPAFPGLPSVLLLAAGTLAGGLISCLQYAVVARRSRHSSPLARLVTTLGVMVLLQALAALRYGDENRYVRSILPADPVPLLPGAVISADQLVTLSVAVVVSATLWFVYRHTLFGAATEGIAENPTVTAALGWRPERIALANWFIGGCLAGLGGVLVTPLVGLQVATLSLLVVTALAAALFGGLSSFPLTLIGALAIGIGQSETSRFVPIEGAPTAVPLVVVLVVLVVTGRSIPLRGELLDRLPRVGDGRVVPGTVVAVGVAALAAIWAIPSVIWVSALTTSMIMTVLLLSLVVLTGYAGQISLAQWTLAGLGAFVAGRLVATLAVPFPVAALAAVLLAIPIGIAFSLPASRTRGASLAVATLSMGIATYALLFNNYNLTGGSLGTVLGSPTLLGIDLDAVSHPSRYATFVLVVLIVAALLVARLRRSRLGLTMLAVRSDERAAGALGIDVVRVKMAAFVVAAVLASSAGVLTAFQGRAVLFTRFDVSTSIIVVAFCVIGGIGYIGGAAVGSLFAAGGLGAVLFAQIDVSEQYLNVAAAAILLVNILTNPDGLADTARNLRRRPKGTGRSTLTLTGEASRSSPGATSSGLTVDGLRVSYGPIEVLRDVSMHVAPGEIVGVIGPNGAGKTTLIDALSGFTPSTGSMRMGERDLRDLPVHERVDAGLSRSFQTHDLTDELTIAENLAVSARRRSAPGSRLRFPRAAAGVGTVSTAALDAVETLGLRSLLDLRLDELSVGQRRLTGVARALAGAPSVVLLDEPAAGLDATERESLVTLLRLVATRWRIGILLVEHDVGLVTSACDRLYAIDVGVVIGEGAPQDVVTSPAVVASYLGPARPTLRTGPAGGQ